MKRLIRLPFAASLFLVLGCHGDALTPPIGAPWAAFSDGAHEGNQDFFFLPPLVSNPSNDPDFEPDTFDPDLHPIVEICELEESSPGNLACIAGDPVRRFEGSEVQVSIADEHYQANWHTDEPTLDVTKYYRIRVLLGGTEIGFADVDPVGTGKELRSVETNQYIGLVDGRTLPIKFRFEEGALCDAAANACSSTTINLAAGGSVELEAEDEIFRLDIAANTQATSGGAPVEEVTFALELCQGIGVDLPVFGKCLRISTFFQTTGAPRPLELTQRALVSMCTFEPGLPDELQEGRITLHQRDGALVRTLPHAPPAPECSEGTIGLAPRRLPGLFAKVWRAARQAAELFTPRPLHANTTTRLAVFNLGGGGETDSFGASSSEGEVSAAQLSLVAATATDEGPNTVSDFQFALPAMMTVLEATLEQTGDPGEVLTETAPGVQVLDVNREPVAGATVRFVVTAGGGMVDLGATVQCGSNPDLACIETNPDGIARVASWTLGTEPGVTNTVQASAFGIAAQNNYPDGQLTPFMPDISKPTAEQSAVSVGTGQVIFEATVRPAMGSLEFTQQPTNTVSGETIDPPLEIRVLDPSGAPVTEAVLVTVGNAPANPATCEVLQDTRLAIEGIATFANVLVNGTCTGARVAVTAGGGSFEYPIVLSDPFDILPAPGVTFTLGPLIIDGAVALVIDGPAVPFSARFTNTTSSTLSGVTLQASIDQGTTTRAAGGRLVSCDGNALSGNMPPGPCTQLGILGASNSGAGTGTLIPGLATARFELRQGAAVLETFTAPIRLFAAGSSIPGVASITGVTPSTTLLTLGGPRISYSAMLANSTDADLSVTLETWIDQDAASRPGDQARIDCGSGLGLLPTGGCALDATINAINTGPGTGVLAPGTATARFVLTHAGFTLDEFSVPVSLAGVVLNSLTLNLEGAGVSFAATFGNTGATRSGVEMSVQIDQGGARRAAVAPVVECGAGTGNLPSGLCTLSGTLTASNLSEGTGTLVPGQATARFQLVQGGAVLQELTARVTLLAAGTVLETGIDGVELSVTSLVINGLGASYEATISNASDETLTSVFVQARVEQGSASRAGGGRAVSCDGAALSGNFPPGRCTVLASVSASNLGAGTGTLVPGDATIRIELKRGETIIDAFTLSVVLLGS